MFGHVRLCTYLGVYKFTCNKKPSVLWLKNILLSVLCILQLIVWVKIPVHPARVTIGDIIYALLRKWRDPPTMIICISTSTLIFLIYGNVGMTHWWKKYGDKGRDGTCLRTTSCPTVHKSHPHKYPCGIFIIRFCISFPAFFYRTIGCTCKEIASFHSQHIGHSKVRNDWFKISRYFRNRYTKLCLQTATFNFLHCIVYAVTSNQL